MEQNEEITEMSWSATASKNYSAKKDYESKLVALWFLRDILKKAEHRRIIVNSNDCEGLGYIILHRNGFTYMVHIKHTENSKPIIEEDFITSSSEFYLKNYFRDIARLKKCTDSNITKFVGDCKNICCVVFTNRDISYRKFLEPCSDDALVHLNTKADVYRVSPRKLPWVIDSSSDLYLLPNQDINDVNEQIIIEMRNILEHFKLAHLNVKDIVEKFMKYITDWAEVECLTNEDVLRKLAAVIFCQYKVNLHGKKFTFDSNDQKNIWANIISNKTVTVVESTEEVEDFLFEYIGNETSKGCTNTWDDYLSTEELDLLHQENKQLTLLDVYNFLWMNGKLPLLLEITSACEYKNILRILALSNYNQKVIVLNKSNEILRVPKDERTITIFRSLRDLDKTDQAKILKQSVKLQGRCLVVLGSIIDENMLDYIKCSDIIRILLNNFNIGNELEPLPAYFIERNISKVFVDVQVLGKVKDEIFLIQEDSEKCFEMLSVQNFNIRRLEDFDQSDFINPNCRIIISRENITWEHLKKFESTKKIIHCLKIYDTKYLEWRTSFGGVYKIEKYRVQLEDTWDNDINELYHNATNIVSASPGMGKSVFLDRIARQAPANKWVLKLNLHEHRGYFQSLVCKSSHTQGAKHLEYFNECDCNSILTDAVFQKFVNTKNLIVLLDGLDEIMVSYKDEVINVINSLQKVCSVWLTTQPQGKTFLEEEFDAFSVTLQPLALSDQKELLIKCYANNVEFVEKCLEAARKNFIDNVELLGTPLLIRLLAEVFSEEGNFTEDFDLIYLYQKCTAEIINKASIKLGVSRITLEEHWSLLALKILFPWLEDKIETFQKETYVLPVSKMHRTFLEYLGAQWLSNNLKAAEKVIQILHKQRFSSNYPLFYALLPKTTGTDEQESHDDNTPLHNAVLQRNSEAINNLLSKGINKQNADDNTPLHLAILDPSVPEKIISKLISAVTTKINLQNNDGNTFLHLVLSKHKRKIAKRLLRKGSDANIENKKGETALHLAAYNGYDDIVAQILPTIADIDKQNHHGRTPLFYAALGNKIHTLKLLISNGADVTLQDVTGETVLHRAAFNGQNHIVTELLSNSADIEKGDNTGCTPLFYATYGNQIGTVKLLISSGACVNVESIRSEIPLHNAAYGGYCDIISELLSNGIDINKQDDEGNTALLFSVFAGQINALKMLISNGANINHRNTNGEIALHRAASYGNIDIVSELLLKGVHVNKQTHFGFTPLHLALMENHLDIVKLLIGNGADIDIDSKDGEIVKLLQKYLDQS